MRILYPGRLGISCLAGAILTYAAIKKLRGIEAIYSPFEMIAVMEIVAAILLMAYYRRDSASKCGLILFSILAIVNMHTISTGAKSCGCFGATKVSPWATLSLDASMAVAYAAVLKRPSWIMPAFAVIPSLFVAVVAVVAPVVPSVSVLGVSHKAISIEPDRWTREHADISYLFPIGSRADLQNSILVFVRPGCEECEEAIRKYGKLSTSLSSLGNPLTIKLVVIGEKELFLPIGSKLAVIKALESLEYAGSTPFALNVEGSHVIGRVNLSDVESGAWTIEEKWD